MGIKRRTLTGGEIFGYLTVLHYSHNTVRKDGKSGERVVICKCKCGAERGVRTSNLYSGNTNSCGCFHVEQTIAANASRSNKD